MAKIGIEAAGWRSGVGVISISVINGEMKIIESKLNVENGGINENESVISRKAK